MHYPARGTSRERHTLCISSQAGCAVGCPFCATGELGFERDLETAEILDQVAIPRGDSRPMGSASRTSCSWAWASRCSTSTASWRPSPGSTIHGGSAWAPGTSPSRRPASCRASGDSRRSGRSSPWRSRSMPRGTRCGTCSCRWSAAGPPRRWSPRRRDHAAATGRRMTYEMAMIDGINDTDADARRHRPPPRRPRPRRTSSR